MADVINFQNKDMIEDSQQDTLIKEILLGLLKESDKIQEIIILVQDKENTKTMYRTEPSIETKSVFIQILQHDVFNDLSPTEDLDFEGDL